MLRRLLVGLALALFVVLGLPASASAFPGDFGSCKSAPMPASPDDPFGTTPAVIRTADPFTHDQVSLESVYGTSYEWFTYDTGCEPMSGTVAETVADVSSLVGLRLPALVPAWGHRILDAVVDPVWLSALDGPVEGATAAVADGVWAPWVSVALVLVAVLTLIRARSGQLSGSVTAAVWALTVLVVVSWTLSYPVQAVRLVDDGVSTAVVRIAEGFGGPTATTPQQPVAQPAASSASPARAQAALDSEFDVLVRSTLYRAWLQGVFGDPDSPTAAKYGPEVFKATHFSWAEWRTYERDPDGAGEEIVERKQENFEQLAEQVKEEDPLAYQHFTGQEEGDRLATALLNGLVVFLVGWFLLVAAIAAVLGFAIIRLFVTVSPAVGVLFLLDSLREQALGILRRAVVPIVMGPLFFLAALVLLRLEAWVLTIDWIFPLQLAIVAALGWGMWRLLRPAAPVQRVRIPGLPGMGWLAMLLAARHGARRGAQTATQEDEPTPDTSHRPPRQRPVHVSATPLPAAQHQPLFLGSRHETAGALPAGVTGTAEPDQGRPALAATPGTFVSRRPRAVQLPTAHQRRTATELLPGTSRPAPSHDAESEVPVDEQPTGRAPTPRTFVAARHGLVEHVRPADAEEDAGGAELSGGHTTGLAAGRPATSADTDPPPADTHATGRTFAGPDPEETVTASAVPEPHEANLILDEQGRPVFQIYRPTDEAPKRNPGADHER